MLPPEGNVVSPKIIQLQQCYKRKTLPTIKLGFFKASKVENTKLQKFW